MGAEVSEGSQHILTPGTVTPLAVELPSREVEAAEGTFMYLQVKAVMDGLQKLICPCFMLAAEQSVLARSEWHADDVVNYASSCA